MQKNILVVDDDLSVTSVFEYILQQAGHHILIASNGEEALSIVASEESIDLIFLDIKIPGMSGIEILKKIQTIRPFALVVMMTGYAVDELLTEAFELGAYSVIYKPFDIDEIMSVTDKIFKLPTISSTVN